MKYRPAKNYPLDIYYLMDLTITMKKHKEALIKVGVNLATTLQSLTENYRIGYGSFVDKPIMPYILLGSEKNPCKPVGETCSPTYDYWHQMSLTTNITQFIDKVRETEISANLDDLEGGFDALMQILVCQSEIGWNDRTRKIVIFATDGKIHFAGDGLLGGVIHKNDKKCHLDENGKYLKALELDYPSVEEIYHVLIDKKVNVIFAVTKNVKELYDELHYVMEDITSVGELDIDSSNILELVERGYSELFKRVQLIDNSPDFIKVTYETDCGGLYPTLQENLNRCDNVSIGNEYEFNVHVTLERLPKTDEEYVRLINILINYY